MRTLTDPERRARLVRRHHLGQTAGSVEQAADALVALHGSDPVSVFLALQARVADFQTDDFERAAYDERTLVRILGMRRTVFAIRPALADVVQASSTEAIARKERRRIEQLVQAQGHTDDPHRWLEGITADVLDHLDDVGEASAKELSAAIPELAIKLHLAVGKPYAGTTGVGSQLLFLLAAEGRLVRTRPIGSWVSSQYRWTRTERWLGRELEALDATEARATLVRRWLEAFGPGTVEDVRWWTGWTLTQTRAALAAVGAVEVGLDGGGSGFVAPDDLEPEPDAEPVAALLPSLDPTTMGWKERDWYLADHASTLFDRNGNAGPTVWWDGRVVGGWAQRADGEVAVRLLEPVSPDARTAIDASAAELQDWFGDRRTKSRFPGPLERELLA